MSTQHSVHCDILLLWQFDPLTFYYCDRWTHWRFTTVTIWPLNILLLWQMDPVTFYYCNTSPPIRYVQVTNIHPPKSRTFCHCNRTSTFFTWIVTGRSLLLWSEMWMFCPGHRGPPGSLLACFRGGGQNVTMVKITMGKTAKSHRSFQTSS